MYNTYDKTKEYFYLDLYENKFEKIGKLNELIYFCVSIDLEDIGMNKNDKVRKIDKITEEHVYFSYYSRRYIFYDGLFRVIDINLFKNEILSFKKTLGNLDWYNKIFYKRKFLNCRVKKTISYFRNGPVPGIHKIKGNWPYFKMPKVMNEKRKNSVIEEYEYIRPSRRVKNLPDDWDDQPCSRYSSKCWKDCSKKRKQWM